MKNRLARMLATPILLAIPLISLAQDPLPSWNDGARKSAIVAFVDGLR